ncbi:hypothetical protein U1Q18_042103, partial [Sarracenia purpurea var. burkii]
SFEAVLLGAFLRCWVIEGLFLSFGPPGVGNGSEEALRSRFVFLVFFCFCCLSAFLVFLWPLLASQFVFFSFMPSPFGFVGDRIPLIFCFLEVSFASSDHLQGSVSVFYVESTCALEDRFSAAIALRPGLVFGADTRAFAVR